MSPQLSLELIGYLASLLILISLMMRSIIRLRWVNLIGATIFSVYGVLMHVWPVAIVNGIISFVDIYYLVDMYKQKTKLSLLEMKDTRYLQHFLQYYHQDIARYFPDYFCEATDPVIAYFILRDTIPAGVLIASEISAETLCIDLDYVVPAYRDFKIAQFIYHRHTALFTSRGYKVLKAHAHNKHHSRYLKQMGFELCSRPGEKELYAKRLVPGEESACSLIDKER